MLDKLRNKDKSPVRKARNRAEEIATDPAQLKTLVEGTYVRLRGMKSDREALKDFKIKINTFVRMIKAYFSGDYHKVPYASIVLAITGVVYFVMPLDLIPDFIPAIGFLDDVAIAAMIFKLINKDIEKFEAWEGIKL